MSNSTITKTVLSGIDTNVQRYPSYHYPEWFIYPIFLASAICCCSCMVWSIASFMYFRKDQQCTVIVVIDEKPEKSSKSKKKPPKTPKEMENGPSVAKKSLETSKKSEKSGNSSKMSAKA
ncbi:uncharacterized protein CELE_Y67D8B.3 [Caenorhabditis elegans]|uniref:Uncharacterized protein n=1 Tax=Caenorhabditis elegans TaxID=6239 RepID=J7RNM5_CAEEL|nr:Uncharacterized protein CELE_Y67D8B.3 [Caenorhabditis elegans]CCM09429.1 Uncharacterized protein CELE_Y67D8B.3 [Caenorhabditis elegans]|eukprot:NP_001263741.1 Uncharacterized protein CELE_Y67D8B.3 [Caenorhabditis elegans]